MRTSPQLEGKLQEYARQGVLQPRTERNIYLKVSYKGAGGLVSDKWNVKIYTTGSVVCNDEGLLSDILAGSLKAPDDSLTVIQCDDSGWGFPLLGVMVGMTDGKRVATRVVDLKYFQSPLFEEKAYLDEYSRVGMELFEKEFRASPKTHRVEICSGYVNLRLKDAFRSRGYDVRITEVKGLLQDSLEGLFRQYVKDTIGGDFAYDPKEFRDNKGALARKYYAVVDWAEKNAPELLKTGWASMKE